MTNKLALAVALALGLLSILGIRSYIAQLDKRVKLTGEQTPFLVFNSEFSAGHVLTQDDIARKEFQTMAIQEALRGTEVTESELPGYLNRPLRTSVKAGQILTQDYFDVSRQIGGELAKGLGPEFRLVTLPVDELKSLAGLLRPGDFVDVIATMPVQDRGSQEAVGMTFTALQDVPVVATGNKTERAVSADGNPYTSVTVRVSVAEANRIVFLIHNNTAFQLVMRPGGAQKVANSNPVVDSMFTTKPLQDLRPR